MVNNCAFGPEWDALVERFGLFQATKDYMEHNGTVRTVEEVYDKLVNSGEITEEEGDPKYVPLTEMTEIEMMRDLANKIPGFSTIFDPINLSPIDTDSAVASETLNFIMESFSKRLNIPYNFVTEQEAQAIILGAGKKYTGEAGFFVGGQVYFIKEKLTPETAFHEFAHPFMRAISIENPELFNKLFRDLENTQEGEILIGMVKNLETDLDPTSDLFKEEVLVRALTKTSIDKSKKRTLSERFEQVVKNILYAIKQAFRKYLGKTIAISDLNQDTTLDELSEIFLDANIDFNVEGVSQADVVSFIREQKNEVDDVVNKSTTEKGAQAIKDSIDRVYRVVTSHANRLTDNGNLAEMVDILETGFGESDLEIIKKNLKDYRTVITDKFDGLVDEFKYTHDRATAFVNTVYQIKSMADKMILHMQEMSKRSTDPDKVKKFFYYQQLTNEWRKTMAEIRGEFAKAGEVAGPILDVIGAIESKLATADNLTGILSLEASSDVLSNILLPLNEEVDRYYKEIIGELQAKGASEALIKRWTDEYENSKVDKATLEKWLQGEKGDTGVIGAWMESFMNIQDPVIFGLAQYVNDNMIDVMTTVQQKYNKQSQEIEGLLKSLGFDKNKPQVMRDALTYVEKYGIQSGDGKFTERERRAFIHHVKGYEIEIDRKEEQIRKAVIKFKETGDRTELDALYIEQDNLLKEFYQDYTDDVYEKDLLFSKDDIGKQALLARKAILQKIQNLNASLAAPADRFEENYRNELAMYWKEYQLLYSLANTDGTMKQGDDLAIAKRLREHREATSKFYEWVPRKGMFEGALKAYEQQLIDTKHPIGSESFNKLRDEWIANNTRVKIKKEFYEKRQEIIDRIQEIKSSLPNDIKVKLRADEIMQELNDQIAGFRDDDGQPDGTAMTKEKLERIKDLNEEYENVKDELSTLQGITRKEKQLIDEFEVAARMYNAGVTEDNPFDDVDRTNRYQRILQKRDDLGLTEAEINELRDKYDELASISSREPTTQYVDIINELLKPGNDLNNSVDGQYLLDTFGATELDVVTANEILTVDVADTLMSQSSKFKDWFMKNHILTSYFTKSGKEVEVYKRTSAWNVTRPVEDKYYETTEIRNEAGDVVEVIKGTPKIDYYKQKLKDQYKTKKVTMKEALEQGDLSLATVDHKGRWLPKPNSKYRNEEYYNIKNRNSDQFELINKILYYHLENQDNLNVNAKLGVEVPRYRREFNETILEGDGKNKLTAWAKNVKASFAAAKDDFEEGYNQNDITYVNLDMFDNEISGIPISGKYDLDLDETSPDVLMGVMRYMQSAERHKKLIEISPQVRAIQNVVNGEAGAIKDMKKASKSDFINRTVNRFATKKGLSVRAKTINAFIEREFEGKSQAGATADMVGLNKTVNNLLGMSSMAFFAFDIPSALKNSLGARFQSMIEAAGGRNISASTLARGTVWGNLTAAEISMQIYKYGPKSLNVQLYQMFDPTQKFADTSGKFAEGISRTFTKDLLSKSWFTNTREWTQLNATLGLFGGMMYHQMVDQTINGVTKSIPYIEAWEVKDKELKLKEGIDPEWGIGGSKFKQMRNKVQAVSRNLNGAYSKYERTQGDRYLLYRLTTFLKRHFVRMFVQRFGYRGDFLKPQARWDVGANQMVVGYYTQSIATIIANIKTMGRDLKYMTPREKEAVKKFITEFGLLFIASLLVKLLFSYDEDDEDRFEKLRQKSGSLPLPWTADSPYDFNLAGYMSNQALFLSIATINENQSFLPFPGYGLDDYRAMLDFDSIAFGNTLSNYVKTMDNLLGLMTDDPSAYYKRSVGPYSWQDEGSAKVFNYLLKSIGLSGNEVDPVTRLKNLESIQNRLKG